MVSNDVYESFVEADEEQTGSNDPVAVVLRRTVATGERKVALGSWLRSEGTKVLSQLC